MGSLPGASNLRPAGISPAKYRGIIFASRHEEVHVDVFQSQSAQLPTNMFICRDPRVKYFHERSFRFSLVIGLGLMIAFVGLGRIAFGGQNPFQEIEALEAQTDLHDPVGLRQLIDSARRLTLHGTARRYARELIKLKPDDAMARELLRQKKFLDASTRSLVWFDWFDAAMWESYKCVRDPILGYCLHADRASAQNGMIRSRSSGLVAIEEWDRQHSQWASAHEVNSRFFHIRSTIPLAAVWYVADDLDHLALSYLDYFEIERLPVRRFTAHLYRTADEASAAKADTALLTRYGAYYSPQQGILHVSFNSLGGLTAVRHEAAHALNREFVGPNPAQWFDEGVGVMCQFARPQQDYSFEFGRFPKHGFGTEFVDLVQNGFRQRMADVHAVSHVTMATEYYSKFRSMVAFFMDANDKQHRMTFINTMFRRQGDVRQLVLLPDIDASWIRYVETLHPEPDFPYLPFPPKRATDITNVLKAGTSAVLYPGAEGDTRGSSPNSPVRGR